MRKQYYFWPGKNGLDAWDVDRLIKLSKDLPVNEINLETLSKDIDRNYWFGDSDEPPTVRNIAMHIKLTNDADGSYPIILSAEGRVMDGMHRVTKALVNSKVTIRAVRFIETPEPDYTDVRPDELPYE